MESVEDYQSLCDLARCGRELWGLETVVMTHGPRANPGQIEAWELRVGLCWTHATTIGCITSLYWIAAIYV